MTGDRMAIFWTVLALIMLFALAVTWAILWAIETAGVAT